MLETKVASLEMKITIYPHKLANIFQYVHFIYKRDPGTFCAPVFHEHWKHFGQSTALINDNTIILDLVHVYTGNILQSADLFATLQDNVKSSNATQKRNTTGRYEPLSNFLSVLFSGRHEYVSPQRFYLNKAYRTESLNKYVTSTGEANVLDNQYQVEHLIHDINHHFGAVDPEIDEDYPLRSPTKPGLFLSPDPILNAAYINSQTQVTSENIIAILASSGVNLALPRVFCEKDDDIKIVKELCADECRHYSSGLATMIRECCDGVKSGNYIDAWNSAKETAGHSIQMLAQRIEQAIIKNNPPANTRVKVGAVDGMVVIASDSFALDDQERLMAAGPEIFQAACSRIIARSAAPMVEEPPPPHSSYSLRIESNQFWDYGLCIDKYNDSTERHHLIQSKEKTGNFQDIYNEYVELLAEIDWCEARLVTIHREGLGAFVVLVGEDELRPSLLAQRISSLRENVCESMVELCLNNNKADGVFEPLSYLKGRRLAANEAEKSLRFGDHEHAIDLIITGGSDRPHLRETEDGSVIAVVEFYYQEHTGEAFAFISVAESGAIKNETQTKIFTATDTKCLRSTLDSMLREDDTLSLRSYVNTLLDIMVKGFGGVIESLEDQQVGKVVFIPHLFLHCLPWHACHSLNDSRICLERFTVVTYSNSSLLYESAVNRSILSGSKYLTGSSFDLAGLPSGCSGALLSMSLSGMYQSISRKYDGRIVINPSKEEVIHILSNSSIFVFEGHAYSDLNEQKLSGLVCRDGSVSFGDIARLQHPIPAFLAILNACQTGLTSNVNDMRDEYYGIDGVLIAGGARTVVSTLWPVDDRASFLVSAKIQFDLLNGFGRDQPGVLLPRCISWLRTGEWKDTWPGIRQYLELSASSKAELSGLLGEENLEKNVDFIGSIDSIAADAFKEPLYWAGWKNTGWGGTGSERYSA